MKQKTNPFPSSEHREENALRSLNYFVMMNLANLKIMGSKISSQKQFSMTLDNGLFVMF